MQARVKAMIYGASCGALLPLDFARLIRGDGVFRINSVLDQQRFYGDFFLTQGSFFFPTCGALLEGLTGNFETNLHDRTLVVNSLCARLYQGAVRCAHARVHMGDSWYVCAPISFDHCALGYAGIVGVFSGGLDVRWQNGWHLYGMIVADQLAMQTVPDKSPDLSVSRVSAPLQLDLTCATAQPVRIDMPQFCTYISGTVHIGGSLQQPCVRGILNLKDGLLQLPFKPLTITHGIIRLVPEHTDHMLVDLVAQTTIGSYTLMVQVNGPLTNPTVCLRSVPALTEEQIAALLISGSTEFSIDNVVPALIADQLKNMIIGGARYAKTGLFARILGPLRSVSVAPQLTEATGNYDLCGSVALDLGDHVQARIQKNLNLKDAATLELNYRIIDDLHVKAFKASQGDVGGQVEWRLKW